MPANRSAISKLSDWQLVNEFEKNAKLRARITKDRRFNEKNRQLEIQRRNSLEKRYEKEQARRWREEASRIDIEKILQNLR